MGAGLFPATTATAVTVFSARPSPPLAGQEPRVLSKVYRVTVADVMEEHPARLSSSINMSKHEAETKRVFGAVPAKIKC